MWQVQRCLPAHPAGEAAHLSPAFTRQSVGARTAPRIPRQSPFLHSHGPMGFPRTQNACAPPRASAVHGLHGWTHFCPRLEEGPGGQDRGGALTSSKSAMISLRRRRHSTPMLLPSSSM